MATEGTAREADAREYARPARRALRLGVIALLVAALVTVLVLREKPGHSHHVYPKPFVQEWTAWCSQHVAIGWCRCAIRKAQTLYDIDEFKSAGVESDVVRTLDRACGAQTPPEPTGQGG
jgi:hypothetical protein